MLVCVALWCWPNAAVVSGRVFVLKEEREENKQVLLAQEGEEVSTNDDGVEVEVENKQVLLAQGA